MDRGAWRATVRGVTKSCKELQGLSTHTYGKRIWKKKLYTYVTKSLCGTPETQYSWLWINYTSIKKENLLCAKCQVFRVFGLPVASGGRPCLRQRSCIWTYINSKVLLWILFFCFIFPNIFCHHLTYLVVYFLFISRPIEWEPLESVASFFPLSHSRYIQKSRRLTGYSINICEMNTFLSLEDIL